MSIPFDGEGDDAGPGVPPPAFNLRLAPLAPNTFFGAVGAVNAFALPTFFVNAITAYPPY
jgi:hypothetical protein